MAYLRLNGWTVPVQAESTNEEPIEIGDRERAFDGTLLNTRRAIKRRWTCRTTMVRELISRALRGLVFGEGHAFPFDADLYSTKGLAPLSSTGVTVRLGTAADGAPVSGEGIFGGSVAVEEVRSNVLTANQSNVETNTSGFTSIDGATLTQDAGAYWQGTKSLKVVTSAAVNTVRGGFFTANASATPSAAYVGSLYVYSASVGSVRVRLEDSFNSVNGSFTTYALVPGQWLRLTTTALTVGGAGAVVNLRVEESTADAGLTFYVDGMQIELGAFATSWVTGGTTRASPASYRYPGEAFGTVDLTINLWTLGQPSPTTAATRAFTAVVNPAPGSAASDIIALQRGSGTDVYTLITRVSDATNNLSTAAAPGASMLTVVLRRNPETGETKQAIYVNGVSVATSSAAIPDLSRGVQHIFIGAEAGGLTLWNGRIDDLQILPYAAPAAQIAAWYAYGRSACVSPRVEMDGDIAPDDRVRVEGQVTGQASQGFSDAGVWRTNGQVLSLTLEEV